MTTEPRTTPTAIPTFDHRQFRPIALADSKDGRSISVCLPARNEEPTIGDIVGTVRRELVDTIPLVDEILVVDDGSTDRTTERAAAAGARVIPAGTAAGLERAGQGKGQALSAAVAEASGDILVFLDADVRNFGAHFVVGVLGPVLLSPDIGFVKAFYRRPFEDRPGEGGRVTELVARPLLSHLFPNLAGVVQPLAGECAVRREVVAAISLADGYGVELAMLIDITRRFGVASLAQVDLGERVHRNRPLASSPPRPRLFSTWPSPAPAHRSPMTATAAAITAIQPPNRMPA